MSLKDQIFAAQDFKIEPVNVPEWSMTVHIRSMTGSERDSFESSSVEGEGKDAKVNTENIRARLLVRVICDEDGRRVFSDDDAKQLGEQKSAAALDRLFTKARDMNGMSERDVGLIAGNLSCDRNGDSTSGSRSRLDVPSASC